MPRNPSGIYSLPESSFVSGTVIRSAPVNNDLADIASALTQSLATTGVSTMTGPIKAASGSVTAPSYTFGSAQGTGFYLSNTNEFSWVANGVLAATFKSDLSVTWVGAHTFGANVTFNSAATFNSAITFSNTVAFDAAATFNAAVSIGSTLNVTGAASFVNLFVSGYARLSNITGTASASTGTSKLYNKAGPAWFFNDPSGVETPITPVGSIINRAYAEFITTATMSGLIPLDSTKPQSGEGDQIVTANITLSKATNRVRGRFVGWVTMGNGTEAMVLAAFSNLSTDAINAVATAINAITAIILVLDFEHAPGNVGPLTYQIRAGITGGSHYNFNTFGSNTLGGSPRATLILEEIHM